VCVYIYIYILQVYKRKNGVVDGTGGGTAAEGTEATGIIVKPYTHTFTNPHTHTHTHTCVALGDVSVYIYRYMYGAFDRGWHVYARTYSVRSLCRRVRPYNGKPFGGDFYIIYTHKYIYIYESCQTNNCGENARRPRSRAYMILYCTHGGTL